MPEPAHPLHLLVSPVLVAGGLDHPAHHVVGVDVDEVVVAVVMNQQLSGEDLLFQHLAGSEPYLLDVSAR